MRPWDFGEYVPRSMEALLDILRCVTLLTRTSTRFNYHIVEALESIPHLGMLIRFGIDNRSIPMPNFSGVEVETIALEMLHNKFNTLDENRKLRYRIAIDRLNLSFFAGIRFVDAAIELGIAIEVIYVPTKASEGISALVRTRAARFLGGTTEERKQRVSLLKDVYTLRSLAIHAGRFDTKDSAKKWQDSNNVSATLNAGQNLIADSIIQLIEDGEPNWDEFDING